MEREKDETRGGKGRRTRKKVSDGSNVPKEVLEQLIEQMGGEAALADPASLLRDLSAALVSRALESELEHHLGYGPGYQRPYRGWPPSPPRPDVRDAGATGASQLGVSAGLRSTPVGSS